MHTLCALPSRPDLSPSASTANRCAALTAYESPTNILNSVQALVAQAGHFQTVDQQYYEDFLALSREEIQRLALTVMIAQESEIRRIAKGRVDAEGVSRISALVHHTLAAMSQGLAGFDPFGRLSLCKPTGPEPSPEIQDALDDFLEGLKFAVGELVETELRWIITRKSNQGELPL